MKSRYDFLGARFKLFIWQWRGVWITTPCITTFVILLRLTGILQSWEWGTYDFYIRNRPLPTQDRRIAIIGIDEADVHKIGQPVLPDATYAKLLEKLKAMEPRAIGLDIYRDLPVPPGHEELIRVFKNTPNLVGIQKVVGDNKREGVAPPPALKEKGQVGANDILADADGRVRRGLFYLDNQDGETIHSFALHLALHYLEKENIKAEIVEGTNNWRIGNQVFIPFEKNDGGYVKTDAGGYQLLINYRGSNGYFEIVSLTDILEDQVPPDWGSDRIIIIGKVGESFNDLFYTPYSSSWLTLPKPMAGVELQANFISQIISAALNERSLIRTWSEPQEWLWIFIWSGVGATATWHWRNQTKQFLSLALFKHLALEIFILFGSTYIGFIYGWWIPIVPPLLALVGAFFVITGYVAGTASGIRKTFCRYLSQEIVSNLLESKEGLKIGGKRQTITVLASDLRGFTALSEKLSSEDVVEIINIYLQDILKIITDYGGNIDKLLGDGIMVLFGAPIVREDDAERAVACALAMQLEMESINKKIQVLGLPALEMGIGINTGDAVVGNIGSEEHTEYTAIGWEVNLAFRVETYAIGNQILISNSTKEAIGISELRIDSMKEIKPKGMSNPINIYEVGGIAGKYNLFLPKEQEILLMLEKPIPIFYLIVEGKQISNTVFKGNLVKLSQRGAEIEMNKSTSTDSIPLPYSNIQLNLLKPDNQSFMSEHIYGKVLKVEEASKTFYIRFTFKPQSVIQQLDSLYQSSLKR
ncbi:MAG: adenylate/guanylate cyclase domain-containing protein [Trichodesmium sp. MO_231.B1]|nr:adenylate/guanylate cyclase domain-containing protein [Trichodesmium sp. MO_231.B1]